MLSATGLLRSWSGDMFRGRWGAFRILVKLEDRAKELVAMILLAEDEPAVQRNPGA